MHADDAIGLVFGQMGEPVEDEQSHRQAASVIQGFLPMSSLSRLWLRPKTGHYCRQIDLDLFGRKSSFRMRPKPRVG
jgi:hypothetical protein